MASGFDERIDAFDLIMNALKDHEKRLDDISHRLESLFGSQSIGKVEGEKKVEQKVEPSGFKKKPLVVCNKWSEFREVCEAAKTVTFEIGNNFFHVYSIINDDIFTYLEDLPTKRLKVAEESSSFSIDKASLKSIDLLQLLIDGKLACGLSLSVKSSRTVLSEKQFLFELSYDLNPDEVKEFLSRELNTSKDRIVEGKITY